MLKPLAPWNPLPTLCCYCRGGEDERDRGLNWTPTQQYYSINRLSLSIKVITRGCLVHVCERTGALMCSIPGSFAWGSLVFLFSPSLTVNELIAEGQNCSPFTDDWWHEMVRALLRLCYSWWWVCCEQCALLAQSASRSAAQCVLKQRRKQNEAWWIQEGRSSYCWVNPLFKLITHPKWLL